MEYLDKKRSTDELNQELAENTDLESFLSENAESFREKDICRLLNELYVKTNLSKAELARRSGMSTVYLHQLFSGKRRPARDKLLCLAIGLGSTVEEAQTMLKQCGHAELYAKDKRDAVIIFGLNHNKSLSEINDDLFDHNMETLN